MNLIDDSTGWPRESPPSRWEPRSVLALASGKPLLRCSTGHAGRCRRLPRLHFNPASNLHGEPALSSSGTFCPSSCSFLPAGLPGLFGGGGSVAIWAYPSWTTILAIADGRSRGVGSSAPTGTHPSSSPGACLTQRQAVLALYAGPWCSRSARWPWVMGQPHGRHHLRGLAGRCPDLLRLIRGCSHAVQGPPPRSGSETWRSGRRSTTSRRSWRRLARIDDVFESIHQFAPAVAASACRGHMATVSFRTSARGVLPTAFEARFSLEAEHGGWATSC